MGGASLGWSGVKDEGTKSCIVGARLGLGDMQCASWTEHQAGAAGSFLGLNGGTDLLGVSAGQRRGSLLRALLQLCQKTSREGR